MSELNVLGHMGCVALSCVLSLVMPAILHAEFTLASVSEQHIIICTCMQDLVACSIINSSECVCHNYPLSMLEHSYSPSAVTYKRLTVWYTSPLNVVRLLNNSEVRHLALAKCNSEKGPSLSVHYFTVRRLERLYISYPFWMPGQNHDVVLIAYIGSPSTLLGTLKPVDSPSTLLGTLSNFARLSLTHQQEKAGSPALI